VNDALLTAIGGIIGGGAVGAWLTGFLTIQQKKIARRQKRRALAYAEAITWMKLVMTAYLAHQAEAGWKPASTEKFVSPVTSATFPFAVPAADAEIALGSNYFAALRAQVVTFGTHDMARAFDRWVNAYSEVLRDGKDSACLRLDAKHEKASENTRTALAGMTCYNAIFPNPGGDPRPGTTNPVRRWHRDVPDELPGCLTRAVENCASWELRHG
jgi:hypothetical protein